MGRLFLGRLFWQYKLDSLYIRWKVYKSKCLRADTLYTCFKCNKTSSSRDFVLVVFLRGSVFFLCHVCIWNLSRHRTWSHFPENCLENNLFLSSNFDRSLLIIEIIPKFRKLQHRLFYRLKTCHFRSRLSVTWFDFSYSNDYISLNFKYFT